MKKLVKESLNEIKGVHYTELLTEILRILEKEPSKLKAAQEIEKLCIEKIQYERSINSWQPTPRGPRGDMDPESWGDPPDWREREMGQ